MRINIDPLESQVMAGEERSHIKGKCIKGASKIGNIPTYENVFFGKHVSVFFTFLGVGCCQGAPGLRNSSPGGVSTYISHGESMGGDI